MMRHYQLIPVRYNDQQLLVRCEPINAELWSIEWIRSEPDRMFVQRPHWFADCAPTEYENAQAIVKWLNNAPQGLCCSRERTWIENNLRRLISLHAGETHLSEFYHSVVTQLAYLDR